MADIYDDYDAVITLCFGAYCELKALCPEHELIKTAPNGPSDIAYIERFWNSKGNWRDHSRVYAMTVALSNCYLEMKKVIDEIGGNKKV
jgi:hypothetical protein